jgi:hypothetical protein
MALSIRAPSGEAKRMAWACLTGQMDKNMTGNGSKITKMDMEPGLETKVILNINF